MGVEIARRQNRNMSGLGDYIRALRTRRVRKKLREEKACYIAGRSNVNFSNCEFEGGNSVGEFTILNHCIFGFGSYISQKSLLEYTSVGRYCAIGPYVHIVHGRHPSRKFVSIHPSFYSSAGQAGFTYVDETRFQEFSYADPDKKMLVAIGNDVWIGDGVSIMEGVHVADGTIIGAGAVVVKDTEPYSIVGGNPARLIRYRFDQEDIDFLLDLRWWNYDREWIQKYAEYFDDIEKFKEQIKSD